MGGATIGIGRDAIDEPENDQERLARAQQNDMACHIAADTIAVLPTVKSLPAGLARATMLINPHRSIAENSGAFTLNVGEGMALNYVGKSMLPGSRLQNSLARNIESNLTREIASHLSVGAGFGFVKSSFDTQNWTDEKGNFTPGKLATNVATSTLGGAALNVPAGMIGIRTMKGSMAALAKVEAPQRLATTIAAAGSGYTSGIVFGGIDAISKGKSFSETLSDMHFAGKVGLVTGGIVGSLDHGSLHSKQRALIESVLKAKTIPVQENALAQSKGGSERNGLNKTLAQPADGSEQKPIRVRPTSDEMVLEGSDSRRKTASKEALDYEPLNYRLSELTTRLKNPRQETMVVHKLKPEAAKKTFASEQEFLANMEPTNVKVRVYDIEGHTAKLFIEEGLAVKMDKTKATRLAVEKEAFKDIPFDSLPADRRYRIGLELQDAPDDLAVLKKHFSPAVAEETLSVLRARATYTKTLSEPLPEDFVVMLDEMPNRGNIKRLVLSEKPNPQDPWNRQKFKNPDFESAASASPDGEITFYLIDGMPKDKPTLRSFMGHEWAHLAANANPEEAGLHHLAILVDRDIPNPNYAPMERTAGSAAAKAAAADSPKSGLQFPAAPADKPTDKYFSRNYARTNADEDLAVHLGEEMLAPDSAKLATLGQNAPVRTTLLARTLLKTVVAAKPGEKSSHDDVIGQRLGYVHEEVMPDAVKLLERRLKQGSAAEQAASSELIGHLGNSDRHTLMLRKLVSNPKSNVVPTELPELARIGSTTPIGTSNGGRHGLSFSTDGNGRTVADIAFDAMLKLRAGNVQNQLTWLVGEAHPSSATRNLAMTRLGAAKHDTAPQYFKLAQLSGNPEKLPELVDLMRTMPDTTGKFMVFQEAYKLSQNHPDFRRSLLGRALETPGLGSKALERIQPDEAAMFEPQLNKLANQTWDKPAQERARTLLNELASGTDLGRVTLLLRSDNPKGVQQGVDIVIASKSVDNRLIEPLLEVAATAPEATSKAARQALLRYNPQVVKFHAQNLRRRGVIATPEALDEVLSRR